MEHFNLCLSESDINTILFTLQIFPSFNLAETEVQAEIDYQCCCSAGKKLIEHRTDLTSMEFCVIYLSLQTAQDINRGELEADEKIKKECLNHLFSINRLISIYDEQIP